MKKALSNTSGKVVIVVKVESPLLENGLGVIRFTGVSSLRSKHLLLLLEVVVIIIG